MSIKYSLQRFTDSSFVRLESDNYHIAFPGPSSGEEGLPSVSPMNEKTTWTKRPKNGYTDRSTQPYPTTFPPQATAREREEDQTKKRTSINKTTRPVHTGRRPLWTVETGQPGEGDTERRTKKDSGPCGPRDDPGCLFAEGLRRRKSTGNASAYLHGWIDAAEETASFPGMTGRTPRRPSSQG